MTSSNPSRSDAATPRSPRFLPEPKPPSTPHLRGVVRLAIALLLPGSPTLPSAAAPRPDTPVANAAERADVDAVQALLRTGADANATQVDGMSALHWAAHHNDPALTTRLLKSGARANATNRYGVTPLSLACVHGNESIVTALLNAGADPNQPLRGGETPLMTAARTGVPGAVKTLLTHGAAADAVERSGQSALLWAAAEGHAAVLQLLIDAGADLHRTLTNSGFTALHFAAREGRIDAVQTLLKAGVDVNEAMMPRQSTGKGPRKGTSALILAVENGHFDLALALLKAGADPNDQRSGFAPLHCLTWVRKPNRGDGDDGDPAPVGSGSMSSLDLARKLVEHGANVNLQLKAGRSGKGLLTRRGATPFLLAASTADLPYLKRLLELGAHPGIPNDDQSTPLMAAAGLGTLAPTEEAGTEPEVLETLQWLLDNGANLNHIDNNGETAMHGAAYKNLPRAVDWLASHGARPDLCNQTNRWGWTPIHIAQGHRVGNFKPSPETLEALHRALPPRP